MCIDIFKCYVRQTWKTILRSFILLALGVLVFSGQAKTFNAEAKPGSGSNVALPSTHANSPQKVVDGAAESVAHRSIDYSTWGSTDESVSEASAIGYVLYDGAAVAGASVTIRGSTGVFTATTAPGPLNSDPYFTVTLSDSPLNAAPGDLFKMEVSYNGEQNILTFMVIAGEQELYGYLSSSCGPTEVTSSVVGDETWTPECGPYIIRQNLKILDSMTLIVTAGTTVEFDAGRSLWGGGASGGALSVSGTPNAMVTFTSHISQTAGSWSYIQVGNSSSPSILSYSLVEYAGGADTENSAAVQVSGGEAELTGVTVRHSASDGVQVYNYATVQMSYLNVSDNAGWGIVEDSTLDYVEVYSSTVRANEDGGIWIKSAGTVTITNNIIADNLGSGIWARDLTDPIVVTENTIRGNQASDGAGVYLAYIDEGYLENNLIWENEASSNGGGVYVFDAGLGIRYNFILHNRATSNSKGGGIYLRTVYEYVPVFRNVIAGNSSVGTGGGIHVIPHDECNMQFNSLIRNQATELGGAVYAHYFEPINLTLENNTILDNTAGPGQGAIHLTELSNPILYNNMYDNDDYTLFYGATDGPGMTLDATGNWWGSIIPSVIPPQIWDKFDDASLAEVDYTSWQLEPMTGAPVSPPTGLVAAKDTFTVTLSWSPNPESDLEGYKLYFSESDTFMIDAVQGELTGTDVGTATSVAITELPLGIYYAAVTAYDDDADGEDDWTDGNESWFSTTEEIHIGTDPQASFSASPQSGEVPLTVEFTDESTGDFDTWLWSFGDGGTSTAQHPTHEYTASGVYTVTLTIDGPLGSITDIKPEYISVLPVGTEPQADFSASPLNGEVPLTVAFTDESTGDFDTWEWAFGDGGTSTDQNPTHIYTQSDVYTVTLTIDGPAGSDTATKSNYISVLPKSELFLPLIEN